MFQSRKALDRLLGASVRQLSTKSGENQTGKGRGVRSTNDPPPYRWK